MTRIFQIIAIAAVLALLAGCASGGGARPSNQTPEQRAQARWDHLLAREWDKAYPYLTPGTRDVMPFETYRASVQSTTIEWTGAKVADKTCAVEDRCAVEVDIDFNLVGGMRGVGPVASKQQIEETWLRIDGEWYFLPRQPTR